MKKFGFYVAWLLIWFVLGVVVITLIRRHHHEPPIRFVNTPEPVTQPTSDTQELIVDHYIPDPKLSPGLALPNVTAEMVSVPGYAKSVRNVPESEKEKVYAEYGIISRSPGEYEIDHIISLELGGSNDIKNLFPQVYHGTWNAHMKDRLEDKLHEMVVKREITLPEAQKAISTDWISAYKKYVTP